MTFSLIMPMDTDRFPQFYKTMEAYVNFGIPEGTEFIIPTRNPDIVNNVVKEVVSKYNIGKDVLSCIKVIPYEYNMLSKNPSMALNLGVKHSIHSNIIVTCPEVMPVTNVLEQLKEYQGKNVMCQVFDESPNGEICMSLVRTGFRDDHPGMYFLAMFNKDDLYTMNGWDEEFMDAYAWEDVDFGLRFNNAGLKFIMADHIQARHQYHPRGGITAEDQRRFSYGKQVMDANYFNKAVKVKRGLVPFTN